MICCTTSYRCLPRTFHTRFTYDGCDNAVYLDRPMVTKILTVIIMLIKIILRIIIIIELMLHMNGGDTGH